MKIDILVVVGVGLLGGSVARAARRVARRIVGVDRDRVAEDALRAGVIDEGADLTGAGLPALLRAADLVVFCTPVDVLPLHVLMLGAYCRPGTLLTDVGSTKASVVRAVDGRLPAGVGFVGSHPLAGSEKSGWEHGRADLFEGRLVFVTPGPATESGALARVCAFWGELGALVEVMSPEEHDRALALTSHLPHLAASALAGVLPPEWKRLAGNGFRDATRLASGSPEVWTAIFRSNRAQVLSALERLLQQTAAFRAALEADDAPRITRLLEDGKRVRDGLPAAPSRG